METSAEGSLGDCGHLSSLPQGSCRVVGGHRGTFSVPDHRIGLGFNILGCRTESEGICLGYWQGEGGPVESEGMWKEAPTWCGMSCPRREAGQCGITRNKCVKEDIPMEQYWGEHLKGGFQ